MPATSTLTLKCIHPECQKTFRMTKPEKEGLYQIACPYCKTKIRVKIQSNEAAKQPLQKPDTPQTKTQAIQFDENTLKYSGQIEWVRRFRPNVVFTLNVGENIIGRDDSSEPSDISIKGDDSVSRRSLALSVAYDEHGYHFRLKVLRARNPVTRNGVVLNVGEEISLTYDDLIVMGHTKLKLVRKK